MTYQTGITEETKNTVLVRILNSTKQEGECVCSTFSKHTAEGHTKIKVDGKKQYTHRVAYEIHKGPIPLGSVVRHTCDNGSCVNPDHLLTGTQKENVNDIWVRGRMKRSLTPEQVVLIFNAKGTQAKIGAEFGVSQSVVSKIKLKQIWPWLTKDL